MTTHAHRLPLCLDPLMAEAKRRMRKRRVLIVVLAVIVGAGATGAAVFLSDSNGFRAAAACPGATSYVYAVPSYPAQPASAPAWPPGQGGDYWGWMPRSHALRVGNWVRLDRGGVWKITGIAALAGDCQFMALDPPFTIGTIPAWRLGGSVSGSLILQPVR
jgi:hypothetical protein